MSNAKKLLAAVDVLGYFFWICNQDVGACSPPSSWFEIIHCWPPLWSPPRQHGPAWMQIYSRIGIQRLEYLIFHPTHYRTCSFFKEIQPCSSSWSEPDLTKRLLFFIFTIQWGRWLEQTPLCSNCFFQFQTFGWCNWFRSLLEKNFLQRILNSCLILKFGIASPFCHSDANSDAAHHLRHSPRHCIASDWTAIFNVL